MTTLATVGHAALSIGSPASASAHAARGGNALATATATGGGGHATAIATRGGGLSTATATATSFGGGTATATATATGGQASAWASTGDRFVPHRHDPCVLPAMVRRSPSSLPFLARLPAQLAARPAPGPVAQQAAPPQQGGGGLLDTIGSVVKRIPVIGPLVESIGGRIGGAVENGKNAFDAIKRGDIGGAIGSGLKALGSLFGF